MLDLKNKKIAIIGCGDTGASLSILAKRLGALPYVFDKAENEELVKRSESLRKRDIAVTLGGYSYDLLKDFETIIISPGVDPTKPPITELKNTKRCVMGDIEFIYRLIDKPFICITGTNGKTTTTRFIAQILKEEGRNIVMGGNMPGASLATQWEKLKNSETIVCEISSFQLEGIIDFRPKVACYLNIRPDHIDRYPDFERYFQAKNRIFMNMGGEDSFVMNYEDELLRALEPDIKANLYYFSSTKEIEKGTFCFEDTLIFRDGHKEEMLFSKDKITLPGEHNFQNLLAGITVGKVLGAKNSSLESAIKKFKLGEHTLEFVDAVNGVKFINDSKGTNVDSVISALKSFSDPIILLAGGKDKGCDYSRLSPYIENKVKALVLFGEARELIGTSIKTKAKVIMVDKMEAGVKIAYEISTPGDLILLSPACSSFDEFDNYAHRGNEFKRIVRSLKSKSDEKQYKI